MLQASAQPSKYDWPLSQYLTYSDKRYEADDPTLTSFALLSCCDAHGFFPHFTQPWGALSRISTTLPVLQHVHRCPNQNSKDPLRLILRNLNWKNMPLSKDLGKQGALYITISFIWLHARFVVAQSPACYYPDGSEAVGHLACNSAATNDPDNSASACCLDRADSYCTQNGLCINGGQPIRASCTDRSYKSKNCPKQCLNINSESPIKSVGCRVLMLWEHR